MLFSEERRNELRLIGESFGKQSPEDKAIQLVLSAHIASVEDELKDLAKQLKTTVKKLAYKAYDQRMKALKQGARPVSGTKNDMKAEMKALALSAHKLGAMDMLKKAAKKNSPKKA